MSSGVPRFPSGPGANFRNLIQVRPSAEFQAANLLQQLGGQLNDIVGRANKRQEERNIEESFIAGQAAALNPDFDINGLPKEGTTTAEGFRKGAIRTFLAQREIDLNNTINNASLEFESTPGSDINEFQAKLQTALDASVQGLPDQVRVPLLQLGQSKLNAALVREKKFDLNRQAKSIAASDKAFFELQKQRIAELSLDTSDAAITARDATIEETLLHINSQSITDNEKLLKAQELADFSFSQAVLGSFENAEDKRAFAADFARNNGIVDEDGNKLPNPLGPEQTNLLISRMDSRIKDEEFFNKTQEEELTATQQIVLELQALKLEERAANGLSSQDEIIEATQNDLITPKKAAKLTVMDRKQKEANAQRATQYREIAEAIFDNERLVINRADSDTIDSINAIYTDVFLPRLAEQSELAKQQGILDEDPNQLKVSFVNAVGFVPKSLAGEIEAALISGTVDEQVGAATMLDQLFSLPVDVSNSFSDRTFRLGKLAIKKINNGIDPMTAVSQARFETDRSNQSLIVARQTDLKSKRAGGKGLLDDAPQRFAQLFGKGVNDFQGVSITGAFAKGQTMYADLFTDFYNELGDADLAHEMTGDSLNKRFGFSKVNGRTMFMEFPPENFLKLSEDDDLSWMKKDLAKSVNTLPATPLDKIILVSDDTTSRLIDRGLSLKEGDPGLYKIFIVDQAGRIKPFTKDGKQQRFRPDPTKEIERRRKKKEKEKKLEIEKQRLARKKNLRIRVIK